MKKNFAILLLVSSAHGYHLRERPQDFELTQAGTLETGIFDRATAKIMKEQEDREKAKEYLAQMAQQAQANAVQERLHQKHLAAAQKEAEEMLGKVADDAKQTAQEKLSQIIHENNLSEALANQQRAEEATGFLAAKAQKTALQQQDAPKGLDLSADLAPEIATQALGQALLDGSQKLLAPRMSDDAKSDMKKKLADKMAASSKKQASALQDFQKLPVIKANNTEAAKQDSVSIYLRNIEEYEKNQQKLEDEKNKQNQPSIAAAHHGQSLEEIAEGNPIADFMALKHPEILENSKVSHEFDDKPLDLTRK